MIARDAYEAAYPAAALSKVNGAYQGVFASMWAVWQAAVVSVSAPAVAEQVDAPSDKKLTTEDAREYLVEFMMANFSDRTFHRYIRGQRDSVNLAGDFAWQMATALRRLTSKMAEQVDALSDEQIDDIARQQREKYGQLCDAEDLRMLARACIAAQKPAAPVQQAAFEFSFSGEKISFDGDEEWTMPATYRRLVPLAQELARRLNLPAAPVQAAPEGWRDAVIDAMGAVSLKNTELAYEKLRAMLAAAPAPRSVTPAQAADNQRSMIIGQAVAHYNGAWPKELSSGVMFFNGQCIAQDEFNERAKLAGYSPRSSA